MKKNIIILVLVVMFVSMIGIFAYNEYEYQNADVHQSIQLVYAEIYELENSIREKELLLPLEAEEEL